MLQRIVRGLRMNSELYQRAARDPSLNREALLLLSLVGLLTGIGRLFDESTVDAMGGGIPVIVGGLLAVACGTLALSGLALLLGRVLFGGTGTFGGVFRAMAYAYLPNAMDVFVGIPIFGTVCYWLSGFWYLALCVVAVRESSNVSSVAASAIVLGPMALAFLVVLMAVGAGVLQ